VKIAFNVVSLYAAWFAAVLAAAHGRPWLAVAASLVAVVANIAFASARTAEVILVVQAALVGIVVDGALINLGLARYASPGPLAHLPPFWLITIWMAFATSLNSSLAWLKDRLSLAALLGLVGGPLAYFAGARLGGMEFTQPVWLALAAVGLLWMAAFPLLLFLARRGEARPGTVG
jgi:hypothetical protein